MVKEILLCKYGEIVLKGANRKYFEDMLCREMKKRARAYGNFDIYRAQSTIYIEPADEAADLDGMFAAASKVFGIVAIARAAVCEKDMSAIAETVKSYIPPFLEGRKTFKVEAKRSDKTFALDSMEISREIGGVVLESCPKIRVDVHHPDIVVKVEIREFGAYVSAGQFKGAGGMPVGTNGKGLLLLSGGIDSPVAGYMMAKRGVRLDAIHFESFPYTSERAREKVLELASIVAEYSGGACKGVRGGLFYALAPQIYDDHCRESGKRKGVPCPYYGREPGTGGVPDHSSARRYRQRGKYARFPSLYRYG